MIVTGLSSEPLDVGGLVDKIRAPGCGGLVVFEGSTRSPSDGREVVRLSYEAWGARAQAQLDEIAHDARARWNLCGVVAMHRIGDVPIGETSVVVAASAPHRAEAFEAARWLIDTLKATVAIWKKEVFADGEAWVGVE